MTNGMGFLRNRLSIPERRIEDRRTLARTQRAPDARLTAAAAPS